MTTTIAPPEASEDEVKTGPGFSLTLSYIGLLLFTVGYYNRPEDFLGGRYLPLALTGGVLAIVAFIAHLTSGGHITRTRETKILLLLLGWLILSIPFASWMGGSFQAFKDTISKVLLLTIVIMNVVTTLKRVRALLVIQVVSVAVLAWVTHFDATGRVLGDNNTAFGNSNDLAVILCINLPVLVFFILEAGYLGRIFYLAMMVLVLATMVLTYSRTGFLAMSAAVAVLIWHLGIKRGHYARVLVLVMLLATAFLVVIPSDYGVTIASIFSDELDISETARPDAAASRQTRQEVLGRAVELTLKHPIFGVGLAGFPEVSGTWRVEHNTYLQYSTEAGLPALFLFVLLIRVTFVNLREAQGMSIAGSETWRLAVALRASFWAFLVGAFFTNFGFEFFPYYIIGFSAAVHQIALDQSNVAVAAVDSEDLCEQPYG